MILRASWTSALTLWIIAALGVALVSSAALANDWRRTGDVDLLIQQLVEAGVSPCPASGYVDASIRFGPRIQMDCQRQNESILISLADSYQHTLVVTYRAASLNENSRARAMQIIEVLLRGDNNITLEQASFALDTGGAFFRESRPRHPPRESNYARVGGQGDSTRRPWSQIDLRIDGDGLFHMEYRYVVPEAQGLQGSVRSGSFVDIMLALMWVPAVLFLIFGSLIILQSIFISFDKAGSAIPFANRGKKMTLGIGLVAVFFAFIFVWAHLTGV